MSLDSQIAFRQVEPAVHRS